MASATVSTVPRPVRLLLPDPPASAQLGLRFALYTGTASLVVEPLSWLFAGGSPGAFLAAADASTLVIVVLRVAHIAAVLIALALLFHPQTRAFFRRR